MHNPVFPPIMGIIMQQRWMFCQIKNPKTPTPAFLFHIHPAGTNPLLVRKSDLELTEYASLFRVTRTGIK